MGEEKASVLDPLLLGSIANKDDCFLSRRTHLLGSMI